MSQPRKTSSPTMTLSALRKRLGRSQAEVATAIGTTQSGVSRIEHQSDMRVSTLNEYVNALGGHLRLVVEHGTDDLDIVIPSLRQYPSDPEPGISRDLARQGNPKPRQRRMARVHRGPVCFLLYRRSQISCPLPALPNVTGLRQDLQVKGSIPLLCDPADQHRRPSLRRSAQRGRTHTRRGYAHRIACPLPN